MKKKIRIVTWFTYLQTLNTKTFLIVALLGIGCILVSTQSDKIADWIVGDQKNESVRAEEQESVTEEGIIIATQYIAIMAVGCLVYLYGAAIASMIVEDRTTRVAETLLCYVKPLELLSGKILGYLLSIGTHMAIWGVSYIMIFKIMNIPNTFFGILSRLVDKRVLVFVLCTVVLGFILYSFLYAALASFIDNAQDVTITLLPVMVIWGVTYLSSVFAMRNPEVEWVKILSYVPFFSSTMSFVAIDLEQITWMEVIMRILIQIVEVIIFAIICSDIYRRAIVSYGKKSIFKKIIMMFR